MADFSYKKPGYDLKNINLLDTYIFKHFGNFNSYNYKELSCESISRRLYHALDCAHSVNS